MPKKNITYAEAMAEIEAVVARIESNELDVDDLSQQIKRVSELIALCRAKLYATEQEVQKIMEGLTAER